MGVKPAKRHFDIEEIKDILRRNVSLYKDQQGFVDFFVELSMALLQQDHEAANQVAPPPRPSNPAPPQQIPNPQYAAPPSTPQSANQYNQHPQQYQNGQRAANGYGQRPSATGQRQQQPAPASPFKPQPQNQAINNPMRPPAAARQNYQPQQPPVQYQQMPATPQSGPGYQQSPKTHDHWAKLPSVQPQQAHTPSPISQRGPIPPQQGQAPTSRQFPNPAPFQKPQAPPTPQPPRSNYPQPTPPPMQNPRSSLTPYAQPDDNDDNRPKTHFEDLKPRGDEDSQRGRPKSHVMGRAKVYRVVRSYKSGSVMEVPCPVCGQKVNITEKYCPACGNSMNEG